MLRRLGDQLNHFLEKTEALVWPKHVETFRLKYPSVRVINSLNGKVPAGVVIWRDRSGGYSVELFSHLRDIQHRLNLFAEMGWLPENFFPRESSELRYGGNTEAIVTWGLFDYECAAGVGEFCMTQYRRRGPFPDLFVLPEDRFGFDSRRAR